MSTKKPAKDEGHFQRELTILFCDIAGYGNFADKMSPTELGDFISGFFDPLTEIILRYKGTVDKIFGDGMICFWDYPANTKDHALQGTLAGLEMIQAVGEIRETLHLPGGTRLDIRVGVNTGDVLVIRYPETAGNTVLGKEANLASLIQFANRRYGTRIMISDSTYEKVKERIFCREVDTLQKEEYSRLVTLYEPLGLRGSKNKPQPKTDHLIVKPEWEEIASIYEKALELYRETDFDGAERALDDVLLLNPDDGPSRYIKKSIAKSRAELGQEGDSQTKGSPPGTQSLKDLTGAVVGRYSVLAQLGAGGMGEVYLAEDDSLKRLVALKRIAPELQSDEKYRKRFLKEAERASSLSDRHIAAVYDVLEENGETFLVMEYVEGQTLRQHLKKPVAVKESLSIAVQCGEGLSAAHKKGIVHGDIKPENIMLTPQGHVKILDFGVAKCLPDSEDKTSTMSTQATMTLNIGGTPAYMAPEVLLEKEPDGRTDLFSLGIVLYESLTRKHPFRADTFIVTAISILNEAPEPITQLNPDAPAELERIVSKMIAKEPSGRYDSMDELLVYLRGVQSYLQVVEDANV